MKTLSAVPATAARPGSTERRSRGCGRVDALLVCALAFAGLGATGCDEQKKTDSLRPSYERPTAPKPDAARDLSCQARLAKGELSFGKDEAKLRTTDGGLVQIADVSVLGGPFEPALEKTLPRTDHVVRLVVDKNGLARCVRLIASEKPVAKEEPAGEIAVDSGTLIFADVARVSPYLRGQPGVLYAGFEGPAGEMDGLAAAHEHRTIHY